MNITTNKTNKKNREDKKISIAIMSSFAILTIQYLMLIYFNLIGTNIGQIIQLTSKILVGLFYMIALPPVLKRSKLLFLSSYLISIFIFILNYALFKENWIYMKSIIFPFFFTALPSFIYAYSIRNWYILKEIVEKVGKVVFIIGIMIAILVFTGNTSVGSYSMSLSYYMLLPTILYMNKFLDKISLKSGFALSMALIVILALGSRGAILCIGVFVILKVIRTIKSITYKKILLYLIIFSLLLTGFVFLREILEYIYEFLLNFGINSRSILLFLRDDVYLSGRDRLYETVVEEIANNPFLGIGLAGDRRVIGGGYVHNIFIEILANFGIIIGSFFSLGIIYLIVKSLFTKDNKRYDMIIIWLSIGLVHLFVSSSYLIDFKFWILLGLLSRNLKITLRPKY